MRFYEFISVAASCSAVGTGVVEEPDSHPARTLDRDSPAPFEAVFETVSSFRSTALGTEAILRRHHGKLSVLGEIGSASTTSGGAALHFWSGDAIGLRRTSTGGWVLVWTGADSHE